MNPVVLASSSPRRRHLLEAAGIAHRVVLPPEDAEVPSGMPVREAARLVAEAKAVSVSSQAPPGSLIVAADTMVVGPSGPLGKPGSPARARAMLAELQGRRHTVLTGVCVLRAGNGSEPLTAVSESTVELRPVGEAEIAAYVDTGEPLDKAGGYAIQGGAGQFAEAVHGRVDTVIGLDVDLVCRLLRQAGESEAPLGAVDATRPAARVR